MNIREMADKIAELEREGNKKEILALIEGMLAEMERGEDKELLVAVLNIYAGALRDVGQIEASIATLKKAKDLACYVYGEDHNHHATLLSNLANSQRVAQCYDDAKQNFEHALRIYEKNRAEKGLIAGIMHNLAILYLETGEMQRGYQLQMQELELLKDQKGYGVAYATALQSVAVTLSQMDRFEESKAYLEQSQELIMREAGSESTVLAGILNTKALLFTERGDLKAAREAFCEALRIVEKNYGNRSEAYLSIKENLLFIEKQIGQQKQGADQD